MCDNDTVTTRGVSTIVSVILLLAITMIFITASATYVFSTGNQISETAPQTAIEFNPISNESVQILHAGGTEITDGNTYQIEIFINNTQQEVITVNESTVYGNENRVIGTVTNINATSPVIKVVWVSPNYGESEILAEQRITLPDP